MVEFLGITLKSIPANRNVYYILLSLHALSTSAICTKENARGIVSVFFFQSNKIIRNWFEYVYMVYSPLRVNNAYIFTFSLLIARLLIEQDQSKVLIKMSNNHRM